MKAIKPAQRLYIHQKTRKSKLKKQKTINNYQKSHNSKNESSNDFNIFGISYFRCRSDKQSKKRIRHENLEELSWPFATDRVSGGDRQVTLLEDEICMRPTMSQSIRTWATAKMYSRRNASTFDYSIEENHKQPKNVYVKSLSTFCQQFVNIFPSTILCFNASHVCCIKLLSYLDKLIHP